MYPKPPSPQNRSHQQRFSPPPLLHPRRTSTLSLVVFSEAACPSQRALFLDTSRHHGLHQRAASSRRSMGLRHLQILYTKDKPVCLPLDFMTLLTVGPQELPTRPNPLPICFSAAGVSILLAHCVLLDLRLLVSPRMVNLCPAGRYSSQLFRGKRPLDAVPGNINSQVEDYLEGTQS